MSYKTYKTIKTVIVMVVAAVVAGSIVAGYAAVPVLSVVVGMLAMYILRKQVKEIMVDERVYSISYRASSLAYRVFAVLAAVIGGTLIALDREGSTIKGGVGFTLAYSAGAMVLIYYIGYLYYGRKMGGGE